MTLRNYLRHAYRTILPLVYARSNMKLFLHGPVTGVDQRVAQLASLSDYFSGFLRPIPIRAPFGESMVVVAPHQDDETIGCGGAMTLQLRAGRPSLVVMLCDGASDHDDHGMSRGEIVAVRNEESRKAAAVIGMEAPRFLDCPDIAADHATITEKLASILAERRADVVFTPWAIDHHPEHRAAARIVAAALQRVNRPVRVLSYEVWGLVIPNVILPIDDAIEPKLQMLACFAHANQSTDYVSTTEGLNMYRARLLGARMCRYAECFFELPSQAYIEMIGKLPGEAATRHAAPELRG